MSEGRGIEKNATNSCEAEGITPGNAEIAGLDNEGLDIGGPDIGGPLHRPF